MLAMRDAQSITFAPEVHYGVLFRGLGYRGRSSSRSVTRAAIGDRSERCRVT